MPRYPVRSDAFAIIEPSGKLSKPDRKIHFSNSTILEHTFNEPGTSRITTGVRLGRMGGRYVRHNDAYHRLDGETLSLKDFSKDTQELSSQTLTVSDTYVTIGEPDWDSIQIPISRLSISPHQHPSSLHVGNTFDLSVAFDGEPLAEQLLLLTRSGQNNRPTDNGIVFKTNEDGIISIPLSHIGTHLIMTRMQAPAPKEADTDIRSHTTSLTFQVKRKITSDKF